MGSPRLHNRLRAARLYVVLSWFLQRVQKTLKALPLKAPLPRRSRETVQARRGGKGGKRTGGPQSLPLPLPSPPAAAIALKPEAPIRQLAKYEAPSAGHAAVGATLFGVLLFLAGARPSLLPAVFLLFVAVALPWRAYHYTRVQPRNSPYLFDFCYAVAGTTAAFLVWPQARQHPQLEAVVYALADGPVAGALVAWQCAWVFHSPDHTISVLLHLLPGLAMAVHHHLPGRDAPAAAAALPGGLLWSSSLWLFAAPLAFYLAWQAAYFFAVQVLGRQYIQANNLDTSYRCLTRRARRAGNIWARLVLRGSTARRLAAYGLVQLAFTALTLLLFIPTYHCTALAVAWQALKVLVPVYFGCKHQHERLYKAAMAEGVRRHMVQLQADARCAGGVLAAEQ